jgi:putative addiction module component (TIGR02574 family)
VRLVQTVEALVAAAKELSAVQREELCEQIAGSLDAPLSVEEAAWADVADRRAEELRSGKAGGVSAEASLARARRRLGL